MSSIYHVSAATPELAVGNPEFNAGKMLELFQFGFQEKAALMVFPELSLTGASCGDLFYQPMLLEAAVRGLERLLMATSRHRNILVVGMPVLVKNRLYDAALVLQKGNIYAAVVKRWPRNSAELQEGRYFSSEPVPPETVIDLLGQTVPVVEAALFRVPGEDSSETGFTFGIELGSDRENLFPVGAELAAAGAQIICNPSADAAVAGGRAKRCEQIRCLSEHYHCCYIYSGAGVYESTGEGVYGGQRILAINGELCKGTGAALSRKAAWEVSAVNPAALDYERRRSGMASGGELPEFVLEVVPEAPDFSKLGLKKYPFIPEDETQAMEYCREIFQIQGLGLARRLEASHSKRMVLGLSGGLDSTLAMLVCVKACDLLAWKHDRICAITMPGAGTSDRTLQNACKLAEVLGVELRTIPIGEAVQKHFSDIGHDPENRNVVYENSQARERTQILMDVANELGGIVIGTGDLSEIALGWSTYNGDHMSMYAVNASVPKTLMKQMVLQYAEGDQEVLGTTLRDIVDTPISPELLPGAQHTEKVLGSYMLHDFFLYYFIRWGEKPDMLLKFAQEVFRDECSREEIEHAIQMFVRRFFTQQFKKNCVPDGVKATEISLSPRRDWQMPSDVDSMIWQKNLI